MFSSSMFSPSKLLSVAPVFHVDAGTEQLTLGNHLIQLENTCGRFLNDTLAVLCHPIVLGGAQVDRTSTDGRTHLKCGFVVFSGSGKVPSMANAASSSVPLVLHNRVAVPTIVNELLASVSTWCRKHLAGRFGLEPTVRRS